MRILTLYPRNRGGGSFVKLVSLTEAMLARGWEVHYISAGEFPIKNKNLHFHKLPFFLIEEFPHTLLQEVLFYLYFWIFSQIYAIFLNLKLELDRLVIFGSHYSFSCFFPRLILKTPLIVFVRGNWIKELESRIGLNTSSRIFLKLGMFIERISLLSADRVCIVTKDLKKILVERYRLNRIKNKIDILYNAIDKSKFYKRNSRSKILKEFNIPKNKFVIGYVGSLDPIKRVDVLIDSFSKLDNKNSFLLVVGKGRKEEELKKQVSNLRIKNKVSFAGWRNDIPEIISALDLLVLPSEYEGCPGVLLESLGCDVPCIGSNVGGIFEILHYNELLFKPADSEDLTKSLKRLINKQDYNKIKELCRKRKSKFLFNWRDEALKRIEKWK